MEDGTFVCLALGGGCPRWLIEWMFDEMWGRMSVRLLVWMDDYRPTLIQSFGSVYIQYGYVSPLRRTQWNIFKGMD